MMKRDVMHSRDDFPLLRSGGQHYLDNAATSQRPDSVLLAMDEFYRRRNANPLRGLYDLAVEATDAYEGARAAVARFINAPDAADIIFTRNTTESINLVAYSYALNNVKAGDEILISVAEHHSNILPWQMVARTTGAALKYIECDKDGSYSDEAIQTAITDKTRIVSIAHVSNVFGRINPVERIIKRAHECGAVVLIDAAQSAPHIPTDVQALDCDFLAFSGHKLLGPMGIGALYGRRELLEAMPPFLSGGEMIEYVTRDSATYAELPHKFEAGTVNAAGAVGLQAAIEYIDSIGFDAMERRELELTQRAMDGFRRIPHVNIIGSDDPAEHNGIITFTVDGVHPHDIAAILSADGVCVRAGHHCAQPLMKYLGVNSTARASIMFYNNEDDVDALIESVRGIRSQMGYAE